MEKKTTFILIGSAVIVLFIIGIFMPDVETSLYTNDVLYDCKAGDYHFPEDDLIFEEVTNVGLLDYYSNSRENECIFTINYKFDVAPTDNPSYKISFDTCKLTVSQLSYFKEKSADLMTMLKDADCVENTIPFIEKVIKPLDFKGQVAEIISNFGTSTTEFTGSFEEWVNGVISYEDFQKALKDKKILASKSFKDLKDLQPTNSEETEIQNKAVKAVELYLDSLNSMEESLSKQSQEEFESSMDKSTAQMDEAITEILDLNTLLK